MKLTCSPPALGFGSGCSVRERQEAITDVHNQVLDNRAARIQARDERMSNSRDVWFQ
jgi:hypothetical protein